LTSTVVSCCVQDEAIVLDDLTCQSLVGMTSGLNSRTFCRGQDAFQKEETTKLPEMGGDNQNNKLLP
jgi:hypothetical protein